jgi:hypothetical protein
VDQEGILGELESLVQSIGLEIRYEKGDFKGGDCILYERNLVVMNKKNTTPQKIQLLSRVVGLYGGDDLFMKPIIRQVVDEEMTRYREQMRELSEQLTDDAYDDTGSERSQS